MFGFRPALAQPAALTGTADFSSPLMTSVRGMSSAEFPKKGYNLKLRDERGGKRAVPLFDLPAYERWALVAPPATRRE